jgi:hypothetical protein
MRKAHVRSSLRFVQGDLSLSVDVMARSMAMPVRRLAQEFLSITLVNARIQSPKPMVELSNQVPR